MGGARFFGLARPLHLGAPPRLGYRMEGQMTKGLAAPVVGSRQPFYLFEIDLKRLASFGGLTADGHSGCPRSLASAARLGEPRRRTSAPAAPILHQALQCQDRLFNLLAFFSQFFQDFGNVHGPLLFKISAPFLPALRRRFHFRNQGRDILVLCRTYYGLACLRFQEVRSEIRTEQ